jgi:tetratricopeptide (TPR) repeat protein
MKRLIAIAIAVVVGTASLPVAHAQARPSLGETLSGEARTKYDIGKILYRDGDYPGALANFRRAYDLSKDPRLLWNMAACEKNLHNYRHVIELVERYLTEADSVLTDDDRREARAFLDAVRKLVASVRIEVNEAGAEVFVDDDPVGASPVAEPVIVSYGRHRFRAKKNGFVEAATTVDVEEGQATTVRLDLRAEVHGGRVTITAAAGDAIAIDGRRVGEGRYEALLDAGQHKIEVSAPGKKKRTLDVVVRDGEARNFDIDLARESTTWPWLVAGGVVLAAGAAVGGYFLFRPSDPEPTSGSALTYRLP